MVAVGVIMHSGLNNMEKKIMEESLKVLEEFEVSFNVKQPHTDNTIVENTAQWLKEFEEEGGKVIIAGDTEDTNIAGMVVKFTTLPVIAVPIRNPGLVDIRSLLNIVQPGCPVATVAINGGRNAALLAIAVLGITDIRLKKALKAFRHKMESEVLAKDINLQQQVDF